MTPFPCRTAGLGRGTDADAQLRLIGAAESATVLEQRMVPQWGTRRLSEIPPDEVQQWLFRLFTICDSWHMMNDLRGITMSRVKIGEK